MFCRKTFPRGFRGTAGPSTSLRYGRDGTFVRNAQKNTSAQQPLSMQALHNLCHPDRSVAKWRDLQFNGPVLEMFFNTTFHPPTSPIKTQAATRRPGSHSAYTSWKSYKTGWQ